MLNFKDHIVEQKNVHMEHIEDSIFNEGVAGTRKAINFLRDLRDMLAGNTKTKVAATVKWDGAPAIFAGVDPSDGKFFVAKKGIFNKNPEVYKTNKDIDTHLTGDLNTKFKVALKEFSKLGIKSGVYQGDMMFTKGDIKSETIDGEEFITFHPNTIVYAVPAKSDLAKKINAASVGVVWHTTYEGDTLETMKASFGKSIIANLKHVPSVWMDDANYKDYSGTATFTATETAELTAILSKIGKLFNATTSGAINAIHQNTDLLNMVKMFNNSKIRNSEKITNTSKHVTDLYNYIHDRYQKEIDKKKTDAGKATQEAARKNVLKFFVDYDKKDIAQIFDLANMIVDAKNMIINKMNSAGHIKTFLRTASGFKTTGVEGFVAIDHLTGGAVKIVDRLEFSKANFSPDIIKGWQR